MKNEDVILRVFRLLLLGAVLGLLANLLFGCTDAQINVRSSLKALKSKPKDYLIKPVHTKTLNAKTDFKINCNFVESGENCCLVCVVTNKDVARKFRTCIKCKYFKTELEAKNGGL